MKKVIDKDGTIRYFNEAGYYHREDGPALEYINGDKFWYKNGQLHREDGPAKEYIDGIKAYWLNGKWLENVTNDEELIIYWLLH